MIRRYFLLILTNFLVTASLMIGGTFILKLLGVPLNSQGLLFVISFAIGMGGSFASLFLSKFLVKRSMGLQVAGKGSQLELKIHELSRQAGLKNMPEVYTYQSSEINAFATGSSRNNSLVAVSSGLLNQMNEFEVEGVLAHEVSHIANGDMVTMTLVQGAANTFAVFLSFIITNVILKTLTGNRSSSVGFGFAGYFIRNIVYGIVSFLALPIVMYVSRWREYRADAGAANLVGSDRMISALNRIRLCGEPTPRQSKVLGVMAINVSSGMASWFSSHPSIENRVRALR